jgi:hypothetical protein
MNPVAKYLAVAAAIFAVLLGCAAAGWTVRGWRCETAMAAYQGEQEEAAQAQFEAGMATEARNEATTEQSTQRLDEQQEAHQKETVYVEKKVIQYRDRWRDRSCKLSDDWLQLYNESLFGTDQAVPEAGPAGSATSVAPVLLPAGRN